MSKLILDAIGQKFQARRPQRAVSLVPSLTETMFAFAAGDTLVGATKYCTEPADGVARLQRVGGTKNPDIEAIRALKPDLVLASVEENRREDVESLIAGGTRVYVTLPTSLRSALEMLTDLAELIAAAEAAEPVLSELGTNLAEIEQLAGALRPVPYFCPIWRRPYMTSGPGTYAYDLLATCGGVSVCGSGAARYFEVDLAAVTVGLPEVILLPDEPYPFAERHKAEFSRFPKLPAVGRGAVHCVDGKALTWYGPRTGPALRSFFHLLHAGCVS